jgi:broad specificity phosphatase PhoE
VQDIYLLRHAHVDYAAGTPITANNPLTPLGHQMAKRLAERCATWGLQRLYASTMRRAQETAEHINARLPDLPRCDTPAFAELHIADLRDYLGEIPPEDMNGWQADHFAFGNERMWARVVQGLDEVRAEMEREGLERVAIVSHGGPINAMIRHTLGQEVVRLRDCWIELDWSTTSCLRFVPQEDGVRTWIRWVNDARHIDDLRHLLAEKPT